MSWSERQRLMLRTMGMVTWAPRVPAVPAPAAVVAPAPLAVAAAAARPAPTPDVVRAPAAAPPAPAEAGNDRSRQIATLDWPALRDSVAACRACALCETRRQTVFGVGDTAAGWMIVGEAPGEQEDRLGEPFVGAAGQLLDSMLRALALTRRTDGPEPPARRVYIANTLKCRPPGNRNPTPAEMQACEPFLMRQVALLKPRLILAMGRFAVQALLRSSEPVGRLRGKVHQYEGVPLVVTYHPAYLLRNLPDKAKAWDDLCLAAQVAEKGAAAG
ncbi:uracil-DNA glycosylase [Pseudorhodoferax sp.]|uniref:uracil-DNA glycosylase n=1 Tax=Pseudorhodoferax sp. TaxID=1993553 RepID=UPI002DD64129|nr:uracil-DNA glycosylase [Pseudorhodoferax sp.]